MGHYRKNRFTRFIVIVALFLLGSHALFAEKKAQVAQKDRRFSATVQESKNPTRTPSESRVALLIGNAAYPSSPLANPLSDVRTLASALRNCGFDVLSYENLTNQGMIDAIGAFEDKLTHKDVGLFYFSGHGMQIKGENFLVPVDAKCQRESQASYECFNVGRLLGVMEGAKARVNIVILDACRNNPLARGYRSLSGGLAKMEAGNQMIIAYSTSPGDVAQDGPSGGNSPYLSSLVNQIRLPGQEIELMFKNVRKNVMKSTDGNQKPWENTSLTDSFCFIPTDKLMSQHGMFVEPQPVVPPEPAKETGVFVNCSTLVAKVRINGVLKGSANQTIPVSDGNKTYSIEVFAPGFITQKFSKFISGDEVISFDANLVKDSDETISLNANRESNSGDLRASWGTRLEFNGGELYFTSGVIKAEAVTLGNYLVKVGIFGGKGATVQFDKKDAKFLVRMVAESGMDNEEALQSFSLFASRLSWEVFNGASVELHACDESMKTLRVWNADANQKSLGTRLGFNGGVLFFTSEVKKAEAVAMGNWLVKAGFYDAKGQLVQLDRKNGKFLFRMIVKPGLEKDTDGFSDFTGKLSREVFKGASVEVHLCDANFKTLAIAR